MPRLLSAETEAAILDVLLDEDADNEFGSEELLLDDDADFDDGDFEDDYED